MGSKMGRYFLFAVESGEDPSRSVSIPEVSASFFESDQKAPDLPNGGLRLPSTGDGLYRFFGLQEGYFRGIGGLSPGGP